MRHAMHESVREVGHVAQAEGFDIHYARGGNVSLARNPAQLARAREGIEEERRWTGDVEELQLLSREEAGRLVGATHVLGGSYTPHCAAIHPARLVRGLAACLERRGIPIYEQTTAVEMRQGAVLTDRGTVRAETLVRATEGYTPSLRGERRRLVPLYSLMIATEPLPAEVWEQIGLRRRETFTDLRHLRIYGQRTADDRLAFGGRGAPYHFRSRVIPSFDQDRSVHRALRSTLVDMFPAVKGRAITHEWGGALAVARDWCASVGLDRDKRFAWAGGYVGDGVATANLGGRTLAQLITGERTELTALPWVNHRSPSWEPEPLRWFGVNSGRWIMASADRVEQRTGKPARRARAFARYTGH
jgi:glycine/D-amino acid oxidase-like deaminating enzyme